MSEIYFCAGLIAALVGSVCLGRNPASSVAALAILAAYVIAEKYFSASFYDESIKKLEDVRADLAVLKTRQDKAELKTAFGSNRNGG